MKRSPALDQAWNRAQAAERAGDPAAAEAVYRQIVGQFPRDHRAWHALALIALGQGRLTLAVQCLEAAVAIQADVALYQRNLTELYRRSGDLPKAIAAGRRAIGLAPADVDAQYNLALALADSASPEAAMAVYRQALRLDERHHLSWNNLGSLLEKSGDRAGALDAYQRAIAIAPSHAEAHNNAGALLSASGDLDAACRHFDAAIRARPDFVEAHYNLSSLKTYRHGDPQLALLEQLYAGRSAMAPGTRIRCCFAAGKAFDDVGDADRAFAAFDEGNRLQSASQPGVDDAAADRLLADILATFTPEFLARQRRPRAAGGPVPIFIVGMPRSGTTLLEQILCSHAQIHGAGELKDLSEVVAQVLGAAAFPAGLHQAGTEVFGSVAAGYLDRLAPLAAGCTHVTDKMPGNYLYLGLIHLALPQAKILHAMRDPMDSCFSCFTRLFNDDMRFAYDQEALGRYYARYARLMDHWREVLPPGTILDAPYEVLVSDTANQARRIIDHLGLPWDASCLEFHRNPRQVQTASAAQVRRPIYRDSVARWKRYARHLRPLYAIVKAFRPDDGADTLVSAPPADSPESLLRAGITRYRQGDARAAFELLDAAVRLKPDFAAALNSRGFVRQDLGELEAARDDFLQALHHEPAMATARLNLGMAQLKLGDFAAGWENYEARWSGAAEAGDPRFARPPCPLPQWNGESGVDSLRLLIITEQGFGDTFQMMRFVPQAAQRFARVGFACSDPTRRLVEWSLGDQVVTLSRLPDSASAWAAWDLHCPLMSLPRAFGIRLDTLVDCVPYLKVPRPAVRFWAERLDRVAPARLRVGIAWAGRREHQSDSRRSVGLEQLAPLFGDPRVCWVSLQKWRPGDARPEAPAGVDWIDWTDALEDFADTAALVSALDLIVSVDSSMVHLAGALNRPVWMLDRFDNEWRWLRHRDDSPWYPSLRIFRQAEPGAWLGPIARLAQALKVFTPPRELSSTPGNAAPPAQAAGTAATRSQVGALAPAQALQAAAQHQSAGRLDQARSLLDTLLATDPHNAHALHLLGVVAYQSGEGVRGIDLIRQAIALQPGIALFHSNVGEMLRQQGDPDAAISHGEQAVALDPSLATACANLGIAYFDRQNYDAAERCHRRALALQARLPQALNNLGSIARARRDRAAAIAWYRQAIDADPGFADALSNLGAVLVESERYDEALVPLEQVLQAHPQHVDALCNLGLVRLHTDRPKEALQLFQQAVHLRPAYVEGRVGLASALLELERLPEAQSVLQQVIALDGHRAEAWTLLGSTCAEAADAAQAEHAYRRAIACDPESRDAVAGLGQLLIEQGRVDEGRQLLDQAVARDPDNLAARYHLMQSRRTDIDSGHVSAFEQRLGRETDPLKRVTLHYGLGKAYDDLGLWDQAFAHFAEGARIKRARLQYDPSRDELLTRRIQSAFSPQTMQRLAGAGDPSEVPVFILGMPRSGTTLTEQILASHPDVHGGGELPDLLDLCQDTTRARGTYPDVMDELDPDALTGWGQRYVAGLRRRAPEAERITDKMPGNYLALGLIPLMLPRARIIHVQRDPIDTCLSCFMQLFHRHQEASYELSELGRHYVNYQHLMDHWRAVLPPGSFLEIRYEDIVAGTEAQARRLVAFCGLPWHDACLEFHRNQRPIRTASMAQVRRPIYQSSVQRWRRYEAHLGPLIEALGPLAAASPQGNVFPA